MQRRGITDERKAAKAACARQALPPVSFPSAVSARSKGEKFRARQLTLLVRAAVQVPETGVQPHSDGQDRSGRVSRTLGLPL